MHDGKADDDRVADDSAERGHESDSDDTRRETNTADEPMEATGSVCEFVVSRSGFFEDMSNECLTADEYCPCEVEQVDIDEDFINASVDTESRKRKRDAQPDDTPPSDLPSSSRPRVEADLLPMWWARMLTRTGSPVDRTFELDRRQRERHSNPQIPVDAVDFTDIANAREWARSLSCSYFSLFIELKQNASGKVYRVMIKWSATGREALRESHPSLRNIVDEELVNKRRLPKQYLGQILFPTEWGSRVQLDEKRSSRALLFNSVQRLCEFTRSFMDLPLAERAQALCSIGSVIEKLRRSWDVLIYLQQYVSAVPDSPSDDESICGNIVGLSSTQQPFQQSQFSKMYADVDPALLNPSDCYDMPNHSSDDESICGNIVGLSSTSTSRPQQPFQQSQFSKMYTDVDPALLNPSDCYDMPNHCPESLAGAAECEAADTSGIIEHDLPELVAFSEPDEVANDYVDFTDELQRLQWANQMSNQFLTISIVERTTNSYAIYLQWTIAGRRALGEADSGMQSILEQEMRNRMESARQLLIVIDCPCDIDSAHREQQASNVKYVREVCQFLLQIMTRGTELSIIAQEIAGLVGARKGSSCYRCRSYIIALGLFEYRSRLEMEVGEEDFLNPSMASSSPSPNEGAEDPVVHTTVVESADTSTTSADSLTGELASDSLVQPLPIIAGKGFQCNADILLVCYPMIDGDNDFQFESRFQSFEFISLAVDVLKSLVTQPYEGEKGEEDEGAVQEEQQEEAMLKAVLSCTCG